MERRTFLKGTAGLVAAIASGARLTSVARVVETVETVGTVETVPAAFIPTQHLWLVDGDTLQVTYPDGEVVKIDFTSSVLVLIDKYGYMEISDGP